jgi:DNA-binding XRE family transcriptional regulator
MAKNLKVNFKTFYEKEVTKTVEELKIKCMYI